MTRPYASLSDEDLIAEINDLNTAKRKAMMGGIAVIAGEGRRVEYSKADVGAMNVTLRELYAEARRRRLDIAGVGGAIKVEFE